MIVLTRGDEIDRMPRSLKGIADLLQKDPGGSWVRWKILVEKENVHGLPENASIQVICAGNFSFPSCF